MRYFLELGYKGTHYSGFQIQNTGVTIQSIVQNALKTYFREDILLTGSSRTDAGVHALQNYFHFDCDRTITDKNVYNLNALLPDDVVIHSIKLVKNDAHSRFDAIYREYQYHIYYSKDPFQKEVAWHYPFRINKELLLQAAVCLSGVHDFTSFSKRNTQVHTFICDIQKAEWIFTESGAVFTVRANRFLRGMVRALVATMLKVGRGTYSLDQLNQILEAKDCSKADFSAPGKGLFLVKVAYPEDIFL